MSDEFNICHTVMFKHLAVIITFSFLLCCPFVVAAFLVVVVVSGGHFAFVGFSPCYGHSRSLRRVETILRREALLENDTSTCIIVQSDNATEKTSECE